MTTAEYKLFMALSISASITQNYSTSSVRLPVESKAATVFLNINSTIRERASIRFSIQSVNQISCSLAILSDYSRCSILLDRHVQ